MVAPKPGDTFKRYQIDGDFGIESLRIKDATVSALGAHQVRIAVKATSINFRDLLVCKGLYNPNLKKPAVPLSDGAGEIVEIGTFVKRVKVGDRVMGAFMPRWISGAPNDDVVRLALGGGGDEGMLAQYVVLDEEAVVEIPAHLSFLEAATLPCAAVTAWHALFEDDCLKPGQTVLTQGTGGVSLFAIQFAQAAGAHLISTSGSDEKITKLKTMGVANTINYKQTPGWGKETLKLTSMSGVDHIVEVGGGGTLGESFKAIKIGGHIALIGVLSGAQSQVNPMSILMKAIRLQGVYVGSRSMFESMNAAISLHKIKPIIDRVFGFEEAQDALRYMESAQHFGKIVIHVG
jgi:NADPH:quinone reductase-like Zn-dependent oxidoreductase